MQNEDVWLVVPLYDEAAVIADVVREARAVFPNVVCVDDGSHDASAERAAQAVVGVGEARAGGEVGVGHGRAQDQLLQGRGLGALVEEPGAEHDAHVAAADALEHHLDVVARLDITQNRMAHASEIVSQIGSMRFGGERVRYAEEPVHILYTDYSRAKGQSLWNAVNILAELIWR